MPEFTKPVDWLDKPNIGYVVNAEFSAENSRHLAELASQINQELGGALFCAPAEALHITLFDWMAPRRNYPNRNKDELFKQIQASYDLATVNALKECGPFVVHFDTIRATADTLIIEGSDDAQFKSIRERFMQEVVPLPETIEPPTIIHSSLGRFIKSVDMGTVRRVLADKAINFDQKIEAFKLKRSEQANISNATVLKQYQLGN
jgi:hypothetical protein